MSLSLGTRGGARARQWVGSRDGQSVPRDMSAAPTQIRVGLRQSGTSARLPHIHTADARAGIVPTALHVPGPTCGVTSALAVQWDEATSSRRAVY